MPSPKSDFERKDRHSGNPKSSVHGEPKKGGAGGSFTWGKAGEEPAPAALDRKDPNYDSSDESK